MAQGARVEWSGEEVQALEKDAFMDAGEAAICTSKKVLAGHQHEE